MLVPRKAGLLSLNKLLKFYATFPTFYFLFSFQSRRSFSIRFGFYQNKGAPVPGGSLQTRIMKLNSRRYIGCLTNIIFSIFEASKYIYMVQHKKSSVFTEPIEGRDDWIRTSDH